MIYKGRSISSECTKDEIIMSDKKYNKNQLVEVIITDQGEQGEGIGRADGYTLFVKDALVGDKVRALITKAKKNYAYARVDEILEPSINRVTPKCKNASRCGGCQIQALSYEAQLSFKAGKVRNDLVRIGGFEEDFVDSIMEPIVGAANESETFRYRNKAQFPIGYDRNGNVIAGFYAGRTHSIIPCDDCYIGIEENKDILDVILSYMKNNHVSAYNEQTQTGLVRHVLIRKGFCSNEIMVCLVLSSEGKVTKTGVNSDDGEATLSVLPRQDELIDSLKAIKGVVSVCASINPDDTNVIMGEKIYVLHGSKVIHDTICLRDVNNDFAPINEVSATFAISPLSFYQVNPVQVEKLYSIAIDYAGLSGEERVWDICCGIGTISLCVAKYMENINPNGNGSVFGIEIVPAAIEDAKKNAKANGITNAQFICAAAEEYLPSHASEVDADVMILDPPRKGMDEAALSVIKDASPKRIVYVSCDPATLSRDLKYLCANGYELKRVRPVDMFMHSVHCETVCLLSNRKADSYVNIGVDVEDYYKIKSEE